jgi:hypothetical protein
MGITILYFGMAIFFSIVLSVWENLPAWIVFPFLLWWIWNAITSDNKKKY